MKNYYHGFKRMITDVADSNPSASLPAEASAQAGAKIRLRPSLKSGFTLIELLCAIAIFSIISIAIYSTFATGILAWRRVNSSGNIYQDARLSFDLLAKDLRNCVNFADEEFSGKKDSISFFTILANEKPSIHKVSYFFDKEEINPTGSFLRQKLSLSEILKEDLEIEPDEIASFVSDLKFEYCYKEEGEEELSWQDKWEGKSGRPRGVKIYLSFKQEKKEPITFTKMVYIPTGVWGRKSGIEEWEE